MARPRILDDLLRERRAHLPHPDHRQPWTERTGSRPTFEWSDRAVEVVPGSRPEVDVLVLQRTHEAALAKEWFGLRPGIDVPCVYVEHDTPRSDPSRSLHPAYALGATTVAHVTDFNALMWDSGGARSVVIDHGVIEPQPSWSGEVEAAAVVVNEPLRRGRVVGTDLLPVIATHVPLHLFGNGTTDPASGLPDSCRAFGELGHHSLHAEVARRRCYLHPYRWTSLGLSLIEAMLMGVPPVGLATTEAATLAADGCGRWATSPQILAGHVRELMHDRAAAAEVGAAARRYARHRFALDRFLDDWDRLLQEVTS